MTTLNSLAKLFQPSDKRFNVRAVKTSAGTYHAFASFHWNGEAERDIITAILDSASIPYRAMIGGEGRMIVVKVDL
jgi:hypothetical protein